MATKKNTSNKDNAPSPALKMPGRTTDEINARQAERDAEGYARVEVGADALDKGIQHRSDFLDEAHADPLLAPNPMEETVAPYKQPGMAYRFLSPKAINNIGRRGYEIVKDDQGSPVTLGNLQLGKIPEKVRTARQKKAEADSTERVQSMADEYTESVNRVRHQAKDLGLRVLDPGEMTGDFTNTETGRTVRIG